MNKFDFESRFGMEVIGFATRLDEKELQLILWQADMDLAGKIEDHVILKRKGEVLAGLQISYLRNHLFHLDVIGVKVGMTGQRIGQKLLSKVLSNPWYYSRSCVEQAKTYKVTTVSQGSAANFYKKLGFKTCGFDELSQFYQTQCHTCPKKAECMPVPMILTGENKKIQS